MFDSTELEDLASQGQLPYLSFMEVFLKIEARSQGLSVLTWQPGCEGLLVSLSFLSEEFLGMSELSRHSAELGHVRKHTAHFDRDTGSQRLGLGSVFSTRRASEYTTTEKLCY